MRPFGSLGACLARLVLIVRSHHTGSERRVPGARGRTLSAKLACFALAIACSAKPPPASTDLKRGESGGVAAPQPLSLDLDIERPWRAPYASDGLWQRAQQGDALDRYALAQREGAEGLLRALRLGGSLGRTALAALRFAPDRALLSAELCQLARHAEARSRYPLLRSLHDLLMEAPVLEEQIDLGANAGCQAELGSLRAGSALSSAERDLVESAISRLEPATPSGLGAR